MSEAEYLTVQEALAAVLVGVSVLPAERVPLLDGLGRVLAEKVVAQDSLPPFANSSMDGYALIAADLDEASPRNPAKLRVVGDVAAGAVPNVTVERGTAVRIMTGAPVPPGADAVIPVEDTNEAWRNQKAALTACAHKLLRIHNALARCGEPWKPQLHGFTA
jgi:molybdopterin molybdotransferase